jgi:hypothetical protein
VNAEAENTRLSDTLKLENVMEQYSEIYEDFSEEGMRLPTLERAAAGYTKHLLSFAAFPQTLGDSIVDILAHVRSCTLAMTRSIELENKDLINELLAEVASYVIGEILTRNKMLDRFDEEAYRKFLNTSLSDFITEKKNDQTL